LRLSVTKTIPHTPPSLYLWKFGRIKRSIFSKIGEVPIPPPDPLPVAPPVKLTILKSVAQFEVAQCTSIDRYTTA